MGADIIFEPKESVAIEGNSGPYLQYAHARARSILAKAPVTQPATLGLEADERTLVRKLSEWAETIDKAVSELMPHHVCTYLYELAQTFNRFYEKNRVIDDPRQAVRLQLVRRYADTLRTGLELLGIAAPERM
jgi:arginyl-tRNA synthetase